MKSIAIFNNKGGVGKSTLTLFMADFYASQVTVEGRPARVLVVDLDAQNSCATALVGQKVVEQSRANHLVISDLLRRILDKEEHIPFADYFIPRPASKTSGRKIPLGPLWIMPSEGDDTLDLEEKHGKEIGLLLQNALRPALARHFDIVFWDLPANIDRRNQLPMAALAVTDFILIPTEPNRITANALEKTFDLIRDAQGAARQLGRRAPKVVGMVFNKTDRRTKQYRRHAGEIRKLARAHGVEVFSNFLPNAPALATASDDSIRFETLRDRYDTYYDHVRKLARELAERCGFARQGRAGHRKAATGEAE